MNKLVKEEDKDDISFRWKKTVCDIAEQMCKIVERKEQEQLLPVLGKGVYNKTNDIKQSEVGDNYNRMRPKQKTALQSSFHLFQNQCDTLPVITWEWELRG